MRVSRRIDPRHSMSREAIADTRKLIRARRHGALQVLLATLMSIAPAAFAQSDSEAPEILAFTLEPTMVDTRSADATIDWCATARDDLSGLRRVVVFLPETVGASPARDESSFAEGALEDTACGTLTLSRGTPTGAYGSDRERRSNEVRAGVTPTRAAQYG